MSFHDPYQHPAPSSSAAAWRAFPYDDHASLDHPSLDHHPHPLDHRTLVLPQVPHIPRQPAGFADDHHPQHDNPQLRGDFYYDGEYAYQPQQRHTQHSLFAAPAHFDALHMGHAQPQGWAPGPEQSFRASEQSFRASEQRLRPSEHFRPSDHPFPTAFPPFDGFPAGSSHPPPRLEPPSLHPTSRTLGGSSSLSLGGSSSLTLGGPLDGPGGGIFYRSPEHPRLRTAQACEKCRVRKAKCSGDHPSCKRCQARGLACEYAKEGRTRGPNKTKKQQAAEAARAASTTSNSQSTTSNSQSRASNSQPRASSTSSEGKGAANAHQPESHADMSRAASTKPPTPPDMVSHLQKEVNKRMSLPTLPRPHRLSLSMGEHRGGSRPRPPDLRLETQSLLYRLESEGHHSAVAGHHSAIDGVGRHHDGLQHTARHGETNGRYHDDHTPRRHGHSLSADAVSPGLTPRYPSLGQGGVSAQMGSSASMSMSGMGSALTSARQSREGSYDGSQGAYNEGGRASFDDGTRGFDDGTRGFDDGSYDGSSCSSEGRGMYASAPDAEMYASAPEAFSHEGSATYSHEGSATYSHEGSATYSHEGSATYSRGGSGTSS
uniref:Zn(2)-C6 fungal-type domain-containing protein n=2 Tax=Schizophyllum commune (strain H4-8 / FGSC 9210) TaxID=578458 RepID=D8QJE6_SCHCM